MKVILFFFGPIHEAIHLLALLLIGRWHVGYSSRHVIVPDDLTTRQYVFVAGLPAVVFILIMALAVLGLVTAHTIAQAVFGLIAALLGGLGAAGTLGDLHLIAEKLAQREQQ